VFEKLVLTGAMEDVEGMAHILGCRVSSLPMKYPSLSLGLLSSLNQYGMVSLKRWNVVWLVESSFICLRVVGSL
jgi:hypothetical protein